MLLANYFLGVWFLLGLSKLHPDHRCFSVKRMTSARLIFLFSDTVAMGIFFVFCGIVYM